DGTAGIECPRANGRDPSFSRIALCVVLYHMAAFLLACAIVLAGQQPAPAPLELKEQHPIFRLEVFGRKPTLEDLLGEKFWFGPTPYGGMTHREFMDM